MRLGRWGRDASSLFPEHDYPASYTSLTALSGLPYGRRLRLTVSLSVQRPSARAGTA